MGFGRVGTPPLGFVVLGPAVGSGGPAVAAATRPPWHRQARQLSARLSRAVVTPIAGWATGCLQHRQLGARHHTRRGRVLRSSRFLSAQHPPTRDSPVRPRLGLRPLARVGRMQALWWGLVAPFCRSWRAHPRRRPPLPSPLAVGRCRAPSARRRGWPGRSRRAGCASRRFGRWCVGFCSVRASRAGVGIWLRTLGAFEPPGLVSHWLTCRFFLCRSTGPGPAFNLRKCQLSIVSACSVDFSTGLVSTIIF